MAEELPTRRRLRRDAPKAERLLWGRLRAGRIDGLKFRRQFGVGMFVVDFYCAGARLEIEIDGESHGWIDAEKRDERRRKYVESFGIRFVRFTNDEVYENLDAVVDEIARIAFERIRVIRSESVNNPPQSPLSKGGDFADGAGGADVPLSLPRRGSGGGSNP